MTNHPEVINDPQLDFFKSFLVDTMGATKNVTTVTANNISNDQQPEQLTHRSTSTSTAHEEIRPRRTPLIEEVSPLVSTGSAAPRDGDAIGLKERCRTTTTTQTTNVNRGNKVEEKQPPSTEAAEAREDVLDAKYLDEMGDVAILSQQQMDEFRSKLTVCKSKAQQALSSKEYRRAAILYGMCIHYAQGKSSILFIKRAECLIQLEKYMSARRDCTRALELNSDATKAYLLRAKANVKLNQLDSVHRDLIYVEPSEFPAGEYDEVKQEYERKREEQRRKHVATEINAKLKFNGVTADQMPAWMTPQLFEKVAKDQELLQAFQTPRLMTAIQDIASNPNAFLKYKNDPQVLQLFVKFSKVMSS